MAIEIKLPELGENIESADITSVLVAVGDQIQKDQVIVEIETDKAVIEVPAEESGRVLEVYVKTGDKIEIGQSLISLETSGTEAPAVTETKEEVAQAAEQAPEPPAPVKEVETAAPAAGGTDEIALIVPELGEGIESADITAVFVSVGDKINIDQALLELETDKASMELPAEQGGIVKQILVEAGGKAEVGKAFMIIEGMGVAPEETAAAKKASPITQVPPSIEEKVEKVSVAPVAAPKPAQRPAGVIAPAAPSVRRFAREIGININEVPGTGPGGRISSKDVKAYAKGINESRSSVSPQVSAIGSQYHEPLPDFTKFGETETEKMSNVRRKTAEHLSFAWQTIPHVTQFDKADITQLEQTRKKFAKMTEARGGKLTVTAILLKVISKALKKFPQFNASIDMENKQIIYKKYYNIGIAVDTDRGLIVPVIKDVDQKSIIDLSLELGEIARKARDKKIGLADLQGGNFTISNLGGLGGTAFTPIVNSPEVAILGVSRGGYEPRYEDGSFVPRLMLPLSLSYDHRIIDGADAVRFVRWISTALEEPLLLAMDI
jgi:pyruvate dehydrogenase E2 component (dihydrolipoamide acetyltransferase)